MILTAPELIATPQQEVRILLHLAGTIEGPMLSYRPTPKQRSTLELLQYMAIMGPTQLTVIEHGVFDRPALSSTWSPAEAEAKGMSFAHAVAAIGRQSDEYARPLGAWTEADFRKEVGCSCISKRAELSTMTLWAGADMPAKA